MRNPYAVLGVSKSASAGEIKTAFRKHAKTHHPDRNPGDPGAASRFSDLNVAYEIVGDESRRRLFDTGRIDSNGRETYRKSFISTFAATLSRHVLNHKRHGPSRA
ncbi:MAG: J domain-containing protein [Hyphomicrobiales bacterium]|nr:J domain-containing protein [Hyphomicrobiales bacterium]MCP5001788.1 J domain-containing protein [Hyphomicrobiales bacterium]